MKIGRGILGVVFLVGIAAVISNSPERAATIDVAHVYGPPAPPAPPSCKNSLSACADNREIANEWSGYSRLRVRCKTAADEMAKYGDPEWPWIAFGSFLPGDSAHKTGVITLVEPDARFTNGFNAKARVKIYCKYNRRADKVEDASIQQR